MQPVPSPALTSHTVSLTPAPPQLTALCGSTSSSVEKPELSLAYVPWPYCLPPAHTWHNLPQGLCTCCGTLVSRHLVLCWAQPRNRVACKHSELDSAHGEWTAAVSREDTGGSCGTSHCHQSVLGSSGLGEAVALWREGGREQSHCGIHEGLGRVTPRERPAVQSWAPGSDPTGSSADNSAWLVLGFKVRWGHHDMGRGLGWTWDLPCTISGIPRRPLRPFPVTLTLRFVNPPLSGVQGS